MVRTTTWAPHTRAARVVAAGAAAGAVGGLSAAVRRTLVEPDVWRANCDKARASGELFARHNACKPLWAI